MTTPRKKEMAPSIKDRAFEAVSPRRYHQLFTIPATDTHGPLKVTYAVIGVPPGEDAPTILFCGGMFGSRWQALSMNYLAEQKGVRVILVDRPGFGGSTPVPLPQRLPTFLEVIPLLLRNLNIKHITIASHSSGTIYALNLLWHHPELLIPYNPSITLFSPWVHQSHTSVSFLVAASMLPNRLLNHWSDLTSFIINNANPVIGASGGAISAVTSLFKSRTTTEEKKKEEEKECREGYGFGLEEKNEITKLVMKFAFAENCKGGNDEARLCLKNTEGCSWDACEDYVELVSRLKVFWEKRVKKEENGEVGHKLKVKIVLAEDDVMIGKKGDKYFQHCWTQEKCGDGIEVECIQAEGTDHENTVDSSKRFIVELFEAAKESQSSH